MNKITQKQLDEFVNDCRKDIDGAEDDHCIILYKCRGVFNEQKFTHKVYKSLDIFIAKGLSDMNEIDADWGIAPQLWFYD